MTLLPKCPKRDTWAPGWGGLSTAAVALIPDSFPFPLLWKARWNRCALSACLTVVLDYDKRTNKLAPFRVWPFASLFVSHSPIPPSVLFFFVLPKLCRSEWLFVFLIKLLRITLRKARNTLTNLLVGKKKFDCLCVYVRVSELFK